MAISFKQLLENNSKVNPASASKDKEEELDTSKRAIKLAKFDDVEENPNADSTDAKNFTTGVKGRSSTAINRGETRGDSNPKIINKMPGINESLEIMEELFENFTDEQLQMIAEDSTTWARYIKDASEEDWREAVKRGALKGADLGQVILGLAAALTGQAAGTIAGGAFGASSALVKHGVSKLANAVIEKRSKEHGFVREDYDDYTFAYKDDCFTLLDEINDLIENWQILSVNEGAYIELASRLRSARDWGLQKLPRGGSGEEGAEDPVPTTNTVSEAYASGELKLGDGSSVNLSELDAHCLNKLVSKSPRGESLDKVARKNSKEFTSILQFAKSLKEEDIQEISKEKLEKYTDKAINDHGMSNFARRSTEGVPGKEEESAHWRKKETNRKKGISTALDKLSKKNIQENSFRAMDRIMGKPRPLTTSERNQKDLRDHKFASSQGGDSSNYKDKDLKKDKKEE